MKRPDDELAELPPGPCHLVYELEALEPGEFSVQLTLFVNDGGTRKIDFTIHGKAAPAASNSKTKS